MAEMNRLRLVLEAFFQRQSNESDETQAAWERMSREIKGSIYTLLALFELVSLTSYIPFDSFNIYQGRFDHMNNLGGLVGALFGEAFMGSTGIMGYTIILITVWCAINAFRGISLRQAIFQIGGAVVSSLLAAMGLHLVLKDSVPEASLLQGGYVGRVAGDFLQRYFNTTGSMLLVGGALFFTLIITTGFSMSDALQRLFGSDEEKEDEEVETKPKLRAVKATTSEPAEAPAPQAPAAPPSKPAKKRGKRAKKADGTVDEQQALSGEVVDGENADATADPEAAAVASGEFKYQEMVPFEGTYNQPSLRLLKSASGVKRLSRGEAKENAARLCEHLLSFQITGEVVAVTQGPVLITYEFKPSAGVKLSKIAALQDDLGIVMGTRELRIIAPIPGKTVVGIEIPRETAEVISLKECLDEDDFKNKKHKIPFALGRATDGSGVFADMAALPHLLVAGATGSGKSVFINSLIMSFIYRCSPDFLRLILVDPKMLELNVFDGLPHLVTNVITDNNIAFNALNWAVWEMDRRYQLMAQTGSKNIDSYNSKQKGAAKIPYLVIVVDELADLMLSGGEAVEVAITRLAQKARAAGIHLVIATQRPSTDVITGLIKANIPSRLSFKVPSGIDSRTVLDTSGAEELIGRGDSLMIQPASPLRRLHGSFVTEEELHKVVKYVKGGKDYSKFYIDFSGKMPDSD